MNAYLKGFDGIIETQHEVVKRFPIFTQTEKSQSSIENLETRM